MFVYRLKDGNSICSYVAAGSEAQPTYEAGTEVTEDVPVEIGHNEDVKYGWLPHKLEREREIERERWLYWAFPVNSYRDTRLWKTRFMFTMGRHHRAPWADTIGHHGPTP